MHALIQTQSWQTFLNVGLVGVSFGMLVAAIVILISLFMLSPISRYPGHLQLFLYSFPTATLTFMISVFLMHDREDSAKPRIDRQPDILKRLEKIADAKTILSLSAQDHYVEVVTELGSELCLIRLTDAIAETSPIDGFQIHRSHWVSRKAIERFENTGGAARVTLTNGTTLKVSQSRVSRLRQYLLISDT